MAVQPTYPGVYVQEVPSGVRTIAGVSTSICCFVGRTKAGPLLRPTRVQTLTDFVRTFGDDPAVGDLSRYARLFFLNGGTDCYVTRIASGAGPSTVTLKTEAGVGTLKLTAKDAGILGDTVRVGVNYNTQYPERTFNLEVFHATTDSTGQPVKADREVWTNLTMDPLAASYAVTVLKQKSKLVDASDLNPPGPAAGAGYSLSGQPIVYNGTDADYRTKIALALGGSSPSKNFRISVDGGPFVDVTIANKFDSAVEFPPAAATAAVLKPLYESAIATSIGNSLPTGVTVTASLELGPLDAATKSIVLRIQSNNHGDVLIQPSGANDAAISLALGTGSGGVEVGAFADRRPAPTGVSYKAYDVPLNTATALLNLDQAGGTAVTSVTLDAFDATGALVTQPVPLNLADAPALAHNWQGPGGVRTKLERWRDAVNAFQSANPMSFRWRAEVWGSRIAFTPTAGGDNDIPPFATGGTNLVAGAKINVRWYRLGASGKPLFQTPGVAGSDGGPPGATDYDSAYVAIDHDVDLFNLLVLPPERSPGAVASATLYSAASVFCQKRRAFLLMDPLDAWDTVQTSTSGISALRIGVVKDHSAIYFPRLNILEDGRQVTVGAAGAVAGLYARIDASRGVWKAPAGTEAYFTGVSGVDLNLTDGESGQINPLGINGIRVMPEGVLSWGARTNDGADMFGSEWKYVPIRRLALFMEESLYRGLKWVVFEPNDAALWAQIRLNVGAFMHGLFRQGAFQGTTPQEAYFVKCDDETTTQADRNLGMVNIWVGFAPVKPAEFVILYLQQIAGQIQT
jgi:phage tail sheath protein FI